jgi:hypothetical protein
MPAINFVVFYLLSVAEECIDSKKIHETGRFYQLVRHGSVDQGID